MLSWLGLPARKLVELLATQDSMAWDLYSAFAALAFNQPVLYAFNLDFDW